MFLRNYDNYTAANHMNESGKPFASGGISAFSFGSTTVFGDGYLNHKHTDGSIGSIVFFQGVSYANSSDKALYPPIALDIKTICLGDGNTPVSYDDYCLSGNIIENKLVKVSNMLTYDAEIAKYKRTLTCTYTNSTDADITIAEYGIFRPSVNSFEYNSNASNPIMPTYGNNNKCVLVFREVLNPIVIAPGTTATLTFEIDVPMTNHP